MNTKERIDEVLIKLVSRYIPHDGVYSIVDIRNAEKAILGLFLSEDELQKIINDFLCKKHGIKYDGILARDLAKSIVENMLEQERGFVKTSPSLKRQPNTTPAIKRRFKNA